MVTLGLAVGMAKTPTLAIGARRFVFWRQAATSTLLLFALLFSGQKFSFASGWFWLAIIISMATYFAIIAAYQAMKTGKIGVISPITSSSSIVTIAFSVLFLGETLDWPQIAAATLIASGIIVLSLNFSDIKNSDIFRSASGIPLALIACFIWGIAYAMYKIPVAAIGPMLAAFAIEFGTFLPSLPANLIGKISFAFPNKKNSIRIALIGLLAAASTLFYNLGISVSNGNVALVAAITFSNPVIVSLYGYIAYKERLTPKQWLGLALTILGIIGISII